MKKKRKLKVRDLKFLKAARLRANTKEAVEKIDAEIAAYTAQIPAHKIDPQFIQAANLAKDLSNFLKHPAVLTALKIYIKENQ